MHDGASQSAIGSRLDNIFVVSLLHGACVINIDTDHFGRPVFTGDVDVGHHINLRVHGIATPYHDQIRLLHLARINAGNAPRSGKITRPTQGDAKSAIHAGIILGMGQALNAIAHDEAHGASIVIGPNAFAAVLLFEAEKALGNVLHRLFPTHPFELAFTLFANAL